MTPAGTAATSALICIALLLSGCIEHAPTPAASDAADGPGDAGGTSGESTLAPQSEDASAPAEDGTLVITTVMPDKSPIPGVNVTVGNASGLTGADGTVRFDDLAPGTLNVTAKKAAHRTAQLTATVRAGDTTRVEAELQPVEGDVHEHGAGIVAHRDTYRFQGHFDCSATYLIITGDCFVVLDYTANEAGVPVTAGEHTEERNIIDFPLDRSWSGLVVEMEWESPATSVDDGMTLALEPAEAPADGHAAKYARTHGASPLRLELAPGVVHATATAEDMPKPDGGEVLRARAFVQGLAHNPGDSTFLGVGASANHEFTLHVSVFYGNPPPADYTALEGGA